MEEEAKAVQEVAKTTGKAIEAAEKVAGFLNKVLGPAFSEAGGIIHDWARYFRLKNLLRIQDKVEALYEMRKIGGKTIPIAPRYAIPLIQNASQEDDESLQDMWAGLIGNFTDPEKRLNPKKIYIEILSSLEPLDAKVLQFFSIQGWKLFRDVPGGGVTVAKLVHHTGATEQEVQLSLQNLARLGCVVDEHVPEWDSYGSSSFGSRVTKTGTTFRPSPLGFDLMKTCEVFHPDDD